MTSDKIHPTAIIDSAAEIGSGVTIGPYCVIEGPVRLGAGVHLHAHSFVTGNTKIGDDTKVFSFAAVGNPPQDLKYHGEKTSLVIGANCTIRENVTINPGTKQGGGKTVVGDNCLLMASSHVAHDCKLGNHVILANFTGVAGHVEIDDYVTMGGLSVIHQHVRIGAYAFVGAMSMVDSDVIPYGMALGNRARLAGLNLIGLKRHKFDREQLHVLRAAYRMIFASEGTLQERVKDAADMFRNDKLVNDVVEFISRSTGRSICLPRNGSNGN